LKVTLANVVSGEGKLVVAGSGTFQINSDKVGGLSVPVTLKQGTLGLEANVNLKVPVTVAGTVDVNTGGGVSAVSGTITGSGTLRLAGVLSGTSNVASGSVAIQGGTLAALTKKGSGILALSATTVLSGSSSVLQGGTLKVASNQTFANVGTIVVGGPKAADTTLDSKDARLDVTAIGGGALVLGGSGSVAQTLKGRGTVDGIVQLGAGATIAPGNSIDTQRIAGGFVAKTGSVYEAEYTMSGGQFAKDMIQVIAGANGSTGAVVLEGGVVRPKAVKIITDFHTEHVLEILSAAGGVTGAFDGVYQTAAIRARLEYVDRSNDVVAAMPAALLTGSSMAPAFATNTPVSVRMVLARSSYTSIGAMSARSNLTSRMEMGRGLDIIVRALSDATPIGAAGAASVNGAGAVDPALVQLLAAADALAAVSDVEALLDTLMPRAFGEMYTLSLGRIQDVQKVLSDRLTLLGSAITTVAESEVLSLSTGLGGDWSAWTNAYGSARSHNANLAAGDGGSSVSSFGDVTGVERRMGRATFGMFGASGTSRTQINLQNSSVRADSWHLGMYLSFPLGQRLFGDVSGFYGEAENLVRQTQALPGGAMAGRVLMQTEEWMLQAGVGGQAAPKGSRWSVVPSVRVAYAGMHFEKANIEGLGALGMRSDAKWNGTVLSRSGLDVAREGKLGRIPVRSTASLAWVHDFNADPRRLGVAWQGLPSERWSISSSKQAQDTLRLGGAVEVGLSERRTLRLYGEQEFLQGNNVLRGGINFTIGF
jgi:hypothetical protein